MHLVPCVLPSPERLVAGPSAHGLAAVVRGEDDDRLVQHALVGEGGLDLADGVVHGRDHGGGRLALLPAEHAAVGADVFLLEETTEVRCLSTTVSNFLCPCIRGLLRPVDVLQCDVQEEPGVVGVVLGDDAGRLPGVQELEKTKTITQIAK